MVLSNAEWVERAKIGLRAWNCLHNHKGFHRKVSSAFDSRWQVQDHYFHCQRCQRTWIHASPSLRAMERCMCQALGPALRDSLFSMDPVDLILERP